LETSIFPSPKTFYGAIFTEYGRQNGENWEDVYEKYLSGNLKISGPFLIKNNIPYFPVPSILKEKEKEILRGYLDPSFRFTINDVELMGIRYDNMRNLDIPEKQLISLKELEKFKVGFSDLKLTETSEIYVIDSKVGIALRKDSRNAEDGALYAFSYYRFLENAGFAFFIDDDRDNVLDNIEMVQLGTKGRLARVEIIEVETNLFDPVEDDVYGALLISPAVFLNGVLPNFCNPIAIANYKPMTYGFWDRKSNKPSTLFKAVPSGSVYYIDSEIKFNRLTDKFSEFGFGSYIQIKK
jgi:CRISPR-associated protein Cmr3